MNDDERAGQDKPLSTSSKSYNFLLTLSKKLGGVATKSFVDVREFLSQDVPIPSSERFLNSLLALRRRRGSSPNDTSKFRQTQASADKLDKAVRQSHEVLVSANTVFPLSLFPDTVLVDRTKITVIKRNFFWSEDVMSIRIQDVLNVSASVGPLFGSLTIASRVMSTVDHFTISSFWRGDVTRLKRIIQGYVIAQHNKLDTVHLDKLELVRTLEELGDDRSI